MRTLFSLNDKSLPDITFPMLLDFLSSYTMVYKPEFVQRTFKGFKPIPSEQSFYPSLSDSQLLYVARTNLAESTLQEHPDAFVLVLQEGKEVPAWYSDYSDRIVIIERKDTFSYFLLLIQEYFIQVLFWSNEMDRIVKSGGTIQDLIYASEGVFDNFISVTDDEHCLIAYSRFVESPGEINEQLIQEGCYTEENLERAKKVGLFFETTEERRLQTIGEEGSYDIAQFSLRANGNYFGHISMLNTIKPITDGQIDLLRILLKRINMVCDVMWEERMRIEAPHASFFIKLISGDQPADKYIETQMDSLAIPKNSQFNLQVIAIGSENFHRKKAIADAASKLNRGKCYHFGFENDLIVLCYSEDDGAFSIQKREKDLNHYICRPFHVYAGTSQVFAGIRDLDMAYRQAKIALELRDASDLEILKNEEFEDRSVYAFEDALIYFLLSQREVDQRFLTFSYSHSMLEKILAEDKKNNTNDINILWAYLCFDRNVSSAAKYLFMHRNTVLYRIEKIEKRFDIDFTDQRSR
ncbi:MAG: hypothetical protein HGA54_10285, partial [Actinobacteria bacterium]|nr:hypothetical protein [Actinomycetota bacterium]